MQHIRGINGPIYGKYRIAAVTGLTTGLAANAPIFAARFAPTALVRAVITDFRLKAQIITPFTAANEISVSAFIARSFTASYTGGTSLLPTGIQNQLSSVDGQGATNFTDIRVATASAIAAGTATLDPNPFLYMPASQPGTSITGVGYFETDITNTGDQRFGPNLQGQTGGTNTNAEGIVVQLPIAQGAGGVVRYCIDLEWVEYYCGGGVGGTITAESIG